MEIKIDVPSGEEPLHNMDTFNMDTFNMDNDDELVAHADLVDEQNHAYEQCLQDDLNHAIAKQEAEEWRRIRLDSWWEEKAKKIFSFKFRYYSLSNFSIFLLAILFI